MNLDSLIDLLSEKPSVGDRLVTVKLGSVNIESDEPFNVEDNVAAVEKSNIFEELTIAAVEKAIKTGKNPKDSKQKFVIPGIGGDFFKLLVDSLRLQVRSNMGKAGALVNRTGQFLNSVKATRVTMDRQANIEVFYTYMKYPYATFSTGGKQYSKNRDPDALIVKSIKELASKQAIKRLKAVPA